MNVATYGFTVVAARIIGPSDYGAFAACLGLLIVINVAALGLQATAARRIAVDQGNVAAIEHAILALATKVALGLGLVLCLLIPAIDALLNLHSLATAAVVAVAAVPATLAGGYAGILQGERRWGALAVFYLASGVPRLAIGTAIILWRPSATSAFLGVAIGLVFPVVVGWWVLRNRRTPELAAPEHSARSMLVESAHNSQALFAYFALTNIDMLVGRSVLDSHDSGLYAAGLIVSRAVMFLPQFVVVIAFPSMSTGLNRARALLGSLALVSGLGAACVIATAVLPDLVLVFAGGQDYAEVRDLLWVFALLGTCMAVLQVLVYSVLARQGTVSMVLVWVALLAVVGVASTMVSTVSELLGVVLVVDLVLLATLLVISFVTLRERTTAQ